MENCNGIIEAFNAVINKLRTAALRKEKLDVSANGTYRAPQNTGYVTVNVDVPPVPVDVRTPEAVTITENGVTNVPDDKVYTPITVNVQGGSTRTEEPITITENGVTDVPADKVYTPITVDVPRRTEEAITITDNGEIYTPNGKYYNPITVNVPIPSYVSVETEVDIDQNGTQEFVPPGSADGFSKITVNTNVPQRVAEALTITENGTTNTPDGKYYNPITVNVPQGYEFLCGMARINTSQKNYTASVYDSIFAENITFKNNIGVTKKVDYMITGFIQVMESAVGVMNKTQFQVQMDFQFRLSSPTLRYRTPIVYAEIVSSDNTTASPTAYLSLYRFTMTLDSAEWHDFLENGINLGYNELIPYIYVQGQVLKAGNLKTGTGINMEVYAK